MRAQTHVHIQNAQSLQQVELINQEMLKQEVTEVVRDVYCLVGFEPVEFYHTFVFNYLQYNVQLIYPKVQFNFKCPPSDYI